MKLPLAQVTMCAVDTRTPALAAHALLRSMAQVQFGRVLLFTRRWMPSMVLPGIELVEADIADTEEARAEFVQHKLPAYVRTSHALLTRWDSCVVDVTAWTDEFLVHDYVGPPWPQPVGGHRVGAGGFSLRSRRFLAAGLDPRLPVGSSDDQHLCAVHRPFLEQMHGVSFAPEALALRFAVHEVPVQRAVFGALGAHHVLQGLPEVEVLECIHRMTPDFVLSDAAQRLVQVLSQRGMAAAVQRLQLRREQLLPTRVAG